MGILIFLFLLVLSLANLAIIVIKTGAPTRPEEKGELLMNIKRRLSVSVAMLLLAAACAVSAIAAGASGSDGGGGDGYVLRGYEGYVAIFDGESRTKPSIITGIELRNLTEADRMLMETGLPAETEAELALLLEDLGS